MTTDLTRPRPPFPYDLLPPLPSFTLGSDDFAEGERIADRFTALAENISPDAPTPSGWWHWTVQDLDVSVTRLPQGAGESDLRLEGAAFHAANDSGAHAWSGPYPPEGDGEHRYVFAVHALDVDTLDLDDEATAAVVAFGCSTHAIARATLTATFSRPGETGAPAFLQGPW